MIAAPVRATATPEKEMNSKLLANKILKFENHESNFFARHRETKHPSREMNHIEIFGKPANGSSKKQANRIFIETDGRSTKASHQEEGRGRRGGVGTHRTIETLRDQPAKLGYGIKAEIREPSHGGHDGSTGGAIAGDGGGGGGGERRGETVR